MCTLILDVIRRNVGRRHINEHRVTIDGDHVDSRLFINRNRSVKMDAFEGLPPDVSGRINAADSLRVVIQGCIRSISSGAFKNCANLVSVEISGNVETIGEKAFNDCERLTSVMISNCVETIKKSAFRGCRALETVLFDNAPHLREVETGAFSDCTALRHLTIPNSVIRIGYEAFKNCRMLETIVIPENANIDELELGDGAFKGCSNLSSVVISAHVREIGWHAFENCISLSHVEINTNVEKIGDCAFNGCNSLNNVTIPESVHEIGTSAFRNSGLNSLLIPAGVERIGEFAFAGCNQLNQNNVAFDGEMPYLGYGSFEWLIFHQNENWRNGDGHIDGINQDELVSIEFENNNQGLNLIVERNIINQIIQEFSNRFGNWLTTEYDWPPGNHNCEVETVRTFGGYSNSLMNSLRRNIDPYETIKQIVIDWGQVRNAVNLLPGYSEYLANVFRQRNNITSLAFVLGQNGSHIASWSKVLAAYKPTLDPNIMPQNAMPGYGDYNIYDSRVAISLSHICLSMDLPCFWVVPDPHELQGIARLEHLIRTNQEKFGIGDCSPNECYALFLDLLRGFARNDGIREIFNSEYFTDIRNAYFNECGFTLEQAIMAHIEKMLFMQKDSILLRYNIYNR